MSKWIFIIVSVGILAITLMIIIAEAIKPSPTITKVDAMIMLSEFGFLLIGFIVVGTILRNGLKKFYEKLYDP